ncbi:MAG: nucleotidyltransferase family protein [Acidobacteriota bacterium]|nr:nucleotidyltransferase family protein [Blastocatellia bacterium]MDW8239326.1 nucleotidyltransferase family protein [Acidobacteriota bacterium]
MSLQPHERLILLCARTRLDDALRERICAAVEQPLCWPTFVAQAKEQELTPLMYLNLKRAAAALVPPETLSHLRALTQRTLIRNALLSEELFALIKLFKREGIAFIPLKGILLAEAVYGDMSLRPIRDLDVMVRSEDLPRVTSLLAQQGFSCRSADPEKESRSPTKHDLAFTKSRSAVKVLLELHWKLKDRVYRLPEEMIWNHRVAYAWRGETVMILSPEMTLLHLVHHLNANAYSLKVLVDVAETLRAYQEELDWDQLEALAARCGMMRNLVVALECANAVLGAPVPIKARQMAPALVRERRWLCALVRDPRWYFSRRAQLIQRHGNVRNLFSALFVDGTPSQLWQAVRSVGRDISLTGLVRSGLRMLAPPST